MVSIGPPQMLAIVAITGVGYSLGRRADDPDWVLLTAGIPAALGIIGLVVTNLYPDYLLNQFPVLMVSFINYVPIELSGLAIVAVFLDIVLAKDGFTTG